MRNFVLLTLLLGSLGFQAFATETNWEGFDYEMAGLSRQEFSILQKSDLDEETFYELMKLGVKPSQYLSNPWEKLGIDEEEWWTQKRMGMSDEDMDQSWKSQYDDRNKAWLSLILPGYYQYSERQTFKGIFANSLNFVGLAAWAYTEFALDDPSAVNFLYLAALGNIYSFVDAWIQVKPVIEVQENENFLTRGPSTKTLGIAFSIHHSF